MSKQDYVRAVKAHAEAIEETLGKLSPETGAFLKQHFDLRLYPIEWIVAMAQALEDFCSQREQIRPHEEA